MALDIPGEPEVSVYFDTSDILDWDTPTEKFVHELGKVFTAPDSVDSEKIHQMINIAIDKNVDITKTRKRWNFLANIRINEDVIRNIIELRKKYKKEHPNARGLIDKVIFKLTRPRISKSRRRFLEICLFATYTASAFDRNTEDPIIALKADHPEYTYKATAFAAAIAILTQIAKWIMEELEDLMLCKNANGSKCTMGWFDDAIAVYGGPVIVSINEWIIDINKKLAPFRILFLKKAIIPQLDGSNYTMKKILAGINALIADHAKGKATAYLKSNMSHIYG